jgi:hypothetical protein
MTFKVYKAHDLTNLWAKTVRKHLFREEVDLFLGIGTNLNDVILSCESADYDFNLQEVWLNKARWTRLIREYIDPQELSAFVRNSRQIYQEKGKHGVVTNMHFRSVERRADLRRHKWGNCLLAATFRGTPGSAVAPTLTLHSRVSYNAYMLGMDMGVAHAIAREIADPSTINLQWHLDVMQLHSFKCLPYLYTQPDLMEVLSEIADGSMEYEQYPTWKSIRRWWLKVLEFEASGKTVASELYGPFKRIRKRYEEYQKGIFVPSVHIDDLDFEKLGEGYKP